MDKEDRLALFDVERGAAGRVTSEKGTQLPAEDASLRAVLLVPERADREVVVVESRDHDLDGRLRGPAGKVLSPKGESIDNFAERLAARFPSYYGLVFPHAE